MIFGQDWVFVENPKTASSAMNAALRSYGGETVWCKHMTLMSSQTAPEKRIKFVVVRNPWDRMVSAWVYNTKEKDEPFEEWLTGDKWECGIGLDAKRCPQTCWAWGCNKVLSYENLEPEWMRLCGTLGLPVAPLPRRNVSQDRPPYTEVYSDRTIAIVADRFAPDIQAWGYSFGQT